MPESLFTKVAGLRPATIFRSANLFKKRLWHRCFPVNFLKFLRIPFLTEYRRWLLLSFYDWLVINQLLLRSSMFFHRLAVVLAQEEVRYESKVLFTWSTKKLTTSFLRSCFGAENDIYYISCNKRRFSNKRLPLLSASLLLTQIKINALFLQMLLIKM